MRDEYAGREFGATRKKSRITERTHGSLRLAEFHGNVDTFAVANDREFHGVAGFGAIQQQIQIQLIGNFFAVDGDEHVAADAQFLQAYQRRVPPRMPACAAGPLGSTRSIKIPVLVVRLRASASCGPEWTAFGAQSGAAHVAVLDQIFGDAARGVDGNGETRCRRWWSLGA